MSLLARSRLWNPIFAWCVALQLVATVASGAPPVTEDTLAQRRKSIASLPEPKRQELARKYDQYQRLSTDERNKLQDLHDVMEAEPDLKKVMDKYCEWLKNLDLTQREQLRQAKTPEQKRNLVVKFYAAQVKRKEDAWREINPVPPEKQRPFIPPLTSDDLKSVMTALEAGVAKPDVLDSKTQAALAATQGTQHYKLLIRAIGDYTHPADGRPRKFEIPKSAKTAFEEAIRHSEGRQKLGDMWRQSDHQRNMFFYLLARSTAEEARREFRGPDADKLKETLFNSLPPEKQLQFTQAPPDRHDPFLMRIHLDELWQAFSRAGDLPRLEGDGSGRSRPLNFFPQFKGGEDNRPQRPLPGRNSDQPPEGRRFKKD